MKPNNSYTQTEPLEIMANHQYNCTILQLSISNFKRVHIQAKEKPKDTVLYKLGNIICTTERQCRYGILSTGAHVQVQLYAGNTGLRNLQLQRNHACLDVIGPDGSLIYDE